MNSIYSHCGWLFHWIEVDEYFYHFDCLSIWINAGPADIDGRNQSSDHLNDKKSTSILRYIFRW